MARITSSAGMNSSPTTRSAVIRPCASSVVFHLLEHHARELAVLDDERLRRAVDDDLDALLLGILELPLGRLEEAARLARHDLHVLRAEAQAGAAAVHRRVADADDQHPLADLLDVAEGHRLEPGDADVDVGGALLAARAASAPCPWARRSRRTRHRSPAASSSRRLLIGWLSFRSTPMPVIIADLFVEHRLRAGGRRGCWCASGRRARRTARRWSLRSRAASGRWRP